jgi:hypothetical protein
LSGIRSLFRTLLRLPSACSVTLPGDGRPTCAITSTDVDPVRVYDILRDELGDVRRFIADLGVIVHAGPSRGPNTG